MKNFDIINFKPALRKNIAKKIKSLTQHWKSASCTVLSVLENAVQPEGINAISGNMEIVVINLIAIGGVIPQNCKIHAILHRGIYLEI